MASVREAAAVPRCARAGTAPPSRSTSSTSRLLNLMQGSFPLEPRPYARVADAGRGERGRGAAAGRSGCSTSASSARSRRSSTRACSATVDARGRQGRPGEPAPRGADRELPPRRVAQLPAQPRLQHVVHDRHRAGLDAGPAGHARRAGRPDRRRVDPPAAHAQAVQDPHEPGDGGRHQGPGRRRRGAGPDRARPDRAVRARPGRDPRAAGGHAGRARALRAGGRGDRDLPGRAARAPRVDEGAPRTAARGRDPLPPPRRLLRQRDGRLEGAGGADHGAGAR